MEKTQLYIISVRSKSLIGKLIQWASRRVKRLEKYKKSFIPNHSAVVWFDFSNNVWMLSEMINIRRGTIRAGLITKCLVDTEYFLNPYDYEIKIQYLGFHGFRNVIIKDFIIEMSNLNLRYKGLFLIKDLKNILLHIHPTENIYDIRNGAVCSMFAGACINKLILNPLNLNNITPIDIYNLEILYEINVKLSDF